MTLRIGTRGNDTLIGTSGDDVLIGDPQRDAALIVVSADSAGNYGNRTTNYASFSPDGRAVVFASASDNLVPNDTNIGSSVYLKDLYTGQVSRISETASGGTAFGTSDLALFTPNGKAVVFGSSAGNLVSGDVNGKYDLFLKNLATGAVTLLTKNANGIQANADSLYFSISPDSSKIVFESDATNLVDGDTNGYTDVFVKDLITGTVTRVSTSATGAQGDLFSRDPIFSPDGNSVLFQSYASNLVPNGRVGVYLKNLATGSVQLVSTNAAGDVADGTSGAPIFSPDGTKVAFESSATNLVAGVSASVPSRIYVKDLVTGAVSLVSSNSSGQPFGDISSIGQFSPDGKFLMFTSTITPNIGIPQQIGGFIKNLVTGELQTITNPFGTGFVSGFEFAPDGSGYSFQAFNGQVGQAFVQITQDLGAGADSLNGGDGFDIVSYETARSAVKVDLRDATGLSNLGDARGDTFASIESFYLSDFADTFIGSSGNDTVFGSGGGDNIDGGAGTRDYVDYYYSGAGVTVNLTLGTGSGGNAQGDRYTNIECVAGSDYADNLTGNAGSNTLDGLQGSDVLTGGDGDDTYYADVLTDSVVESNSNSAIGGIDRVLFEGAVGTYLLTANVENLELIGTSAISGTGNTLGNQMIGNVAANTLRGEAGDDTIIGNGGGDILDGGTNTTAGDTLSYSGSSAGVFVSLATNTAAGGDALGDTISNFENITGSGQDDILFGSLGLNVILGAAGDDTIGGFAGGDTLDGGTNTAAGDTVSYDGSSGGVAINLALNSSSGGDAAGDLISNFENVIGSASGDILIGDNGNNTLSGGAGNDLFVGGLGADTMIGGADLDVVDYSGFGSGVSGNLTTGTGPGGDVISEIENIIGSAFGDVLDGNNGANTMRGGAGNDFMVAGNGSDLLIGGADNDEVSYATATMGVLVNLSTGTGANGGVLQEIENIRGSNFGDVLQGDNGANTIRGLDGNDFIIAGNGADLLIGGNDNDTVSYETATSGVFANLTTGVGANGGVLQEIENLTGSNFGDLLIGNSGGNTLKGGGGNDFIVGNSGSDALEGGADNDTFRFETSTFGNDVIVDFQDNADKLSFGAAVATNFNQFTILNNNTTNVTVQIAGQSIVVQGVANISLTASDFLFV